MQGKAKLAQALNLFDHIQYMISDQCSLPHLSIEDGTTSLISLNILKSAEGFIQHLQDFLWLSIFELVTKLVVHRSLHNTSIMVRSLSHF